MTVLLGSVRVVLSSDSYQAEGDITGLSVVPVEGRSLAARGSITCLQTHLYINLPNLQHNRPITIN